MALWIDQLCFGSIGRFSSHMMIYRTIDIIIFFVRLGIPPFSARSLIARLDPGTLAGSRLVRCPEGK